MVNQTGVTYGVHFILKILSLNRPLIALVAPRSGVGIADTLYKDGSASRTVSSSVSLVLKLVV